MENDSERILKMYILLKDTTPIYLAPLITAHAAMGAYRKFRGRILMSEWLETELFRKAVCSVTPEQFEKSKEYGEFWAVTENKHKHLGELGLGFDIREEYPKFFKFLPLYRPVNI
jgi:hypothetical protein